MSKVSCIFSTNSPNVEMGLQRFYILWPTAGDCGNQVYRKIRRRRGLGCCHSLCAANICQSVLIIVPPAISQVDSSNEGNRLVNDHQFLVVSPQINGRWHVVRVPHHLHAQKVAALASEELTHSTIQNLVRKKSKVSVNITFHVYTWHKFCQGGCLI